MKNPFDYRITQDNRVLIYRNNSLIMTLGSDRARQLISKLGVDDD